MELGGEGKDRKGAGKIWEVSVRIGLENTSVYGKGGAEVR